MRMCFVLFLFRFLLASALVISSCKVLSRRALTVISIGVLSVTVACNSGPSSRTAANQKIASGSESKLSATPESADQRAYIAAQASARHAYVEQMRLLLLKNDVDARVMDFDGTLAITSSVFEQKSDRDRFMSNTFGAKYRQSLCAMGFKSVEVKNGILTTHGNDYSLGCKETAKEKQARLAAELERRRDFVSGLNSDFSKDPGTKEAQVEDQNGVLVITNTDLRGAHPSQLRAFIHALLDDEVIRKKYCFAGIRGVRLRTSSNTSGVFIPNDCSK